MCRRFALSESPASRLLHPSARLRLAFILVTRHLSLVTRKAAHASSRTPATFPADFGQAVVFRPAVVVRLRPLRGDPALRLHPVERRVKRALLELQRLLREDVQFLRDPPPVHLAAAQDAEYEQIEGALGQF